MIKELVRDTDVLSTPCEPCTEEDGELAQDLLDTLAATEDASCIAANQIGVTKCAFAYLDDNDKPHVVFNPRMTRALGAFRVEEGCLTLDETTKSTRYQRMTLAYDEPVDGKLVSRKREFNGWTAQIIQHMVDHCKGKLVSRNPLRTQISFHVGARIVRCGFFYYQSSISNVFV